jgi:hypothetical protein
MMGRLLMAEEEDVPQEEGEICPMKLGQNVLLMKERRIFGGSVGPGIPGPCRGDFKGCFRSGGEYN